MNGHSPLLRLGRGVRHSKLPTGLKWKHILGTGFLAGTGFTMSIFIILLALDTDALVVQSKIAIMAASLVGAVIRLIALHIVLRKPNAPSANSGARMYLID
jgi:NhaA family Na+:H+ antiporter